MMYQKMGEQADRKQIRLIEDAVKDIFTHLQVSYSIQRIPLNEDEHLFTVFVPCSQQDLEKPQNFFIGHGFGGTSLLSFGFVQPLLTKGNVIFWDIRGMGFSGKLESYQQGDIMWIQAFFLKSIEVLLEFYNHKNCTFLCHSLSGYLTLLFTIRFQSLTKIHIKKLILFSPIGITTKQQDYKNSINNCSDILHTLLNKFGWAFKLTYKSPLRTICSCCKNSLIMNSIKDIECSQKQKEIISTIVKTLVLLPDGSQTLFFDYFQPRVIPRLPIEPILIDEPIVDILMVFGGEEDWVDKTGAKKISTRFPDKIKFTNIQGCGHNIPFCLKVCKEIFNHYL